MAAVQLPVNWHREIVLLGALNRFRCSFYQRRYLFHCPSPPLTVVSALVIFRLGVAPGHARLLEGDIRHLCNIHYSRGTSFLRRARVSLSGSEISFRNLEHAQPSGAVHVVKHWQGLTLSSGREKFINRHQEASSARTMNVPAKDLYVLRCRYVFAHPTSEHGH